jgi:surfactin synthase thioesterase subunit
MKPLILLTLAHAGGSASALAHFRRHLPQSIEARPVELPGHGRRFREPLLAARAALVAQLASELLPTLHGQSYALFGHSLGGMLAFDLAHALIAGSASVPRAVCVAAAPAPCSQGLRRPLETWQTDEALLQSLRTLGGTPPELFDHPELLELFLPIVRADFKLCSDVPVLALGPLPCPVHVYAGRRDDLSEDALQG